MKLTVEWRRIGSMPARYEDRRREWCPCPECEASGLDVSEEGEWRGGSACGLCGGAGGFFLVSVVDLLMDGEHGWALRVVVFVSDWAYERVVAP